MRCYIIEAPDLQTLRSRFGHSVVTLVLWMLWIYLWAPLISFIAWVLGFKLLHEQMTSRGGIGEFTLLLQDFWPVLFTIIVVVAGWSTINAWRFRGQGTRTKSPKIGLEEIGSYFEVPAKELGLWQMAKKLIFNFDDEGKGRFVSVEAYPPSLHSAKLYTFPDPDHCAAPGLDVASLAPRRRF